MGKNKYLTSINIPLWISWREHLPNEKALREIEKNYT